jgi:hypothetical protein
MGAFFSWWIIMNASVWSSEQGDLVPSLGIDHLDTTTQERLDMSGAILHGRRVLNGSGPQGAAIASPRPDPPDIPKPHEPPERLVHFSVERLAQCSRLMRGR